MEHSTICRLCVTNCSTGYKQLFDERGLGTEIYELVMKFFNINVSNNNLLITLF